MNYIKPKHISYLELFEKVAKYVLRALLIVYFSITLIFKGNDRVENLLAIAIIVDIIIWFGIFSMLRMVVDREFFKRPRWLATGYVYFSTILLFVYYELLEIQSFLPANQSMWEHQSRKRECNGKSGLVRAFLRP